jgi:glycosyltransferase involved in cell wall biosynthesis
VACLIHFFPTFSRDAKDSPFAQELVALNVPHRLFAGEVILRYRSRIWLLLLGWPKVAYFGLASSLKSLILSRPYPDAVVVGSHIEALIFGLFRALRRRRKPTIVLLGFIMTSRSGALLNRIRGTYFDFVFSIVDQVICHSTLEVERYTARFISSRAKFVYIPYGLYISGREGRLQPAAALPGRRAYFLAAGRSGRDYATLFEAVEPLAIDLHVVCDSENSLAGLRIPPNVTVLRDCYDDAYVNELRNALFVAIPLGVNDISAGQMVLIQAMAFAKPTIVTRTTTVEEYVADGEQSLLVAQGSVPEFREAINKLLGDSQLAARLAANALDAFEQKFCMRVYVQNLVASVALSDESSTS